MQQAMPLNLTNGRPRPRPSGALGGNKLTPGEGGGGAAPRTISTTTHTLQIALPIMQAPGQLQVSSRINFWSLPGPKTFSPLMASVLLLPSSTLASASSLFHLPQLICVTNGSRSATTHEDHTPAHIKGVPRTSHLRTQQYPHQPTIHPLRGH